MTTHFNAGIKRPLAALLWSFCVLAVPGTAIAVNEVEPNNTWAGRQSISNSLGNFTIDGSRQFSDTSDDFFSFLVGGLGLLRIEASSADGSADSIMGLFSGDGTLLASNDDGGTGAMSVIEYAITEAGIYGIGFSGYNPGLLACVGAVTQCYDTDNDFVFDTFVAGGGAGGSAGWDYRISITGPALIAEPNAALLVAPALFGLLLMGRRRAGQT